MTRLNSLLLIIFLFGSISVQAQNLSNLSFTHSYSEPIKFAKTDSVIKSYPNPGSVLRRSMLIPGWGQATNRQIWKVPIIYGLLGGLAYYSTTLTKQYHDYRAAYYNVINGDETDFRFGQTPSSITSTNTTLLRSRRNNFRNRRDFIYVSLVLAYALNAIDAYVYAHLRTFDVSDDLSMNMYIAPEVLTTPVDHTLGLSLKINLFTK